jgi:hypothetical protein
VRQQLRIADNYGDAAAHNLFLGNCLQNDFRTNSRRVTHGYGDARQ